jgi:hypothetical protein
MRFRGRHKHDAQKEALRGSTTRQLLGDTNKALAPLGWERFSAVGRIGALGEACSDTDLLAELSALWKDALEEDPTTERAVYASGLVRIMEVLEERIVRMRSL